MEDQEKLLFNEREAAQLLAMSIHFLRRDRISHSSVGIPYIRIGTAVRYRRVDLEDWIGRQMQVQPSGPRSAGLKSVVAEAKVKRRRGRPRKKPLAGVGETNADAG